MLQPEKHVSGRRRDSDGICAVAGSHPAGRRPSGWGKEIGILIEAPTRHILPGHARPFEFVASDKTNRQGRPVDWLSSLSGPDFASAISRSGEFGSV